MSSSLLHRINKQSSLLIFAILSILFCYQATLKKLAISWATEGNSHGFLLFAICIYLLYKAWVTHKDALVISLNGFGLLLLLGTTVIWLLANFTLIEYVELVSLPLTITFALIALLGWRQSQVFWFPILLMLLAGPLLALLIPYLQEITASATGLLLQLTGITNMVDGVLILIPVGTFEVDRGCSGINVLTVGSILSLLYAYINRFTIKQGAMLLLIGTLVSVLANVIRVYIIVLVGHATNMMHPLIKDHGNLGWIVFAVLMGVFLFIVHRYWPVDEGARHRDESMTAVSNQNPKVFMRNQLGTVILTIFVASIGPVGLFYTNIRVLENPGINSWSFDKIDGWRVINNDGYWRSDYKAGEGDVHIEKIFINDANEKIYLDLRYYARQSIANEAVNETNTVYERGKWTRVWIKLYEGEFTRDIAGIEETLIQKNNNKEMLVWRWYFVGGKMTGNAIKAKFYNLLAILTGKPEIFSYIIATDAEGSYDVARKRLSSYVGAANNIIHVSH